MNHIRNSVKAVIVRDGKLLLTKNKDDYGFFYLLPGGGQEFGESMHEALARECREEISCDVEIMDILFIRDYIGKNHEFAAFDNNVHQIEYMFECRLKPGSEPENGKVPDSMQVGVEWVPLRIISGYRIYPSALKELIGSEGFRTKRTYLGDVN